MSQAIMDLVEKKYTREDAATDVEVGDEVEVYYRIIEGSKERIQRFAGVVIRIQGGGLTETFTVRRIVANEGVERTFPFQSPRVSKVEIKRKTQVRRARLYFLRDRVGKSRRLPDRRSHLGPAKK